MTEIEFSYCTSNEEDAVLTISRILESETLFPPIESEVFLGITGRTLKVIDVRYNASTNTALVELDPMIVDDQIAYTSVLDELVAAGWKVGS